MSSFVLRVFRGVPGNQYWEEFELELQSFLNVTSALMLVQAHPVNRKGERVAPVTWEQGCLEEVCGSCSMLVNGYPRQGCTALIENLLLSKGSIPFISLAPLSKFPLIRDLVVDRSSMFEHLKKIRAWIDSDGAQASGQTQKISQELQQTLYTLSTCMTCGCCSEACPQVNSSSAFMGPAPISQARLFNAHPVGELAAPLRVRPLMEKGGVSECGNAQNCAVVCPKKIPLTESIAVMGRQVVKQAIQDLTGLPDG